MPRSRRVRLVSRSTHIGTRLVNQWQPGTANGLGASPAKSRRAKTPASLGAEKIVQCPECGCDLKKINLQRHLRKAHAKKVKDRMPCPICKVLVQTDRLKRHVRKQHNPEESSSRVACPTCGVMVMVQNLPRHFRNVHQSRSSVSRPVKHEDTL